jgi:hypothetical protein
MVKSFGKSDSTMGKSVDGGKKKESAGRTFQKKIVKGLKLACWFAFLTAVLVHVFFIIKSRVYCKCEKDPMLDLKLRYVIEEVSKNKNNNSV